MTGSGASWDPFSIEIPGVDPPTPGAQESSDAVADDVEESVLSVVDDMDESVEDTDSDAPDDEDRVADADEVAKQLASLSPKAARAVAAAAKASTGEERDAALAEASDDDEEPINRGLLLKFLSSVKS